MKTSSARFTIFLLATGSISTLHTTAVLALGMSPDFSTLFWGIAGLPLVAWGIWRFRNCNARLPWPRCIKRLLALSAALSLVSFAAMTVWIFLQARDESARSVPFVIVLGSGLSKDGQPTSVLVLRLEKAREYLEAHPESRCIVSGGMDTGARRSEAGAMSDYLVKSGIKDDRILREKRSSSTWENLLFSRELLGNVGTGTSVLIVTNDFHMARAKMLADRLGYHSYSLPCASPWYQYPNVLFREYFATVKSLLFDVVVDF